MPVELASWLGDEGLLDDFDDYWFEAMANGSHGDAWTPYAKRHDAPADVLKAIRDFG